MAKDPSSYPIWVVLNRLIEQYGPSPTEFVQTLRGYGNPYKRLRRLNLWLHTADGHSRIIKEIATKYPDHADELNRALAETKAIMAAEFEAAWVERCKSEAASFRPFIYSDGSQTVPNGIVIFGISGGHERWTITKIPRSVLDLPLDEQLAALPELMVAYRHKYDGAVPFFGTIQGFKFVRLLDYFQFDADGRFVEHVDRPFRPGGVEIFLR